jgi:hypothetical protein
MVVESLSFDRWPNDEVRERERESIVSIVPLAEQVLHPRENGRVLPVKFVIVAM